VCHGPGKGTGILGILHNSVSITDGANQAPIVFGADQKAAAVVIDLGIYYGILPEDAVTREALVIGFQVYRDKRATEKVRAFDSSVTAYANAMANALTGGTFDESFAICGEASHPFCDEVKPLEFPRIH
jgi:formaldehyde-activating enzyme involved in methanogenesis